MWKFSPQFFTLLLHVPFLLCRTSFISYTTIAGRSTLIVSRDNTTKDIRRSIIQVTKEIKGTKERLVLYTTVTGSVLYSLGIKIVFDVVRELPDDPDCVKSWNEILDSEPSGNPGRAWSPDGNKAFKRWRCALSDDVFVVLKVQHRLAVRTSFIPELAHALHHTAQHACSVELWGLSSSFQRGHFLCMCSGIWASWLCALSVLHTSESLFHKSGGVSPPMYSSVQTDIHLKNWGRDSHTARLVGSPSRRFFG